MRYLQGIWAFTVYSSSLGGLTLRVAGMKFRHLFLSCTNINNARRFALVSLRHVLFPFFKPIFFSGLVVQLGQSIYLSQSLTILVLLRLMKNYSNMLVGWASNKTKTPGAFVPSYPRLVRVLKVYHIVCFTCWPGTRYFSTIFSKGTCFGNSSKRSERFPISKAAQTIQPQISLTFARV